ncbi:MAG: hypothetical protein MRY83_18385 [Flavobacteriales bacterium]|nr:hypothetical protein [Flavobacteriales bacterium]
MNKRVIAFVLIGTIALIIGSFYCQKIVLPNADLGRHLKNGELFSEFGRIISTNFYSYTEPEFDTPNHHWGSGVVFYHIERLFGFKGLSIFFIFINVLAWLFCFLAAKEKSNYWIPLILSVTVLPLLSYRIEIRPESFSYFFIGLNLWLLALFQNGKISFSKLIVILLINQLIWVNLHVLFAFGFLITGFLLVNEFFNKGENFKKYLYLTISQIIISLINPSFVNGLIEPFIIFKEYGYMVAENQSVFFMQDRYPKEPIYVIFEICIAISVLISLFHIKKLGFKDIGSKIAFLVISLLAFKTIRSIQLWSYFFLFFVSGQLYILITPKHTKKMWIAAVIIFIAIGISYKMIDSPYIPKRNLKESMASIGLYKNTHESAKFFKNSGISGRIFNNYDIGGYLIYHLFPKNKVFVDNRPEAYSVDFFKDIYEPMQSDESFWDSISTQYNFNSIFFYRHDNTEHAQPFLIRRIQDPEWIPVFVDGFNIILVKNNDQNKRIIEKYALPEEMFKVVPGS